MFFPFDLMCSQSPQVQILRKGTAAPSAEKPGNEALLVEQPGIKAWLAESLEVNRCW